MRQAIVVDGKGINVKVGGETRAGHGYVGGINAIGFGIRPAELELVKRIPYAVRQVFP